MQKKENRRITLTKKMLKEALLRLLERESLEQINISELCREADINRTTFYKYYTSPHDVLTDIGADLAEGFRSAHDLQNAELSGKEFLELICAYLYKNAELVKVLIRCNTDADFAKLLNDFYESLWSMKGRLQGMDQLDAESVRLISTYLGSGCYYLLRQWLIEEIPKTPQEVAELLCRLITKE